MVNPLPPRNCQGTIHRFHPFYPFHLFRPLDNFITFPCRYSTSPSLSNTPSFSINFRVFPLFHFYLTFHFPLSFSFIVLLFIVVLFIVLCFIVLVTCPIVLHLVYSLDYSLAEVSSISFRIPC